MKRKVNTLQGFKKGGKKQDWVSEKISMLMKEGRPQDQAIAMALSMWSQKHEDGGYQLPMYEGGDIFGDQEDYENDLIGKYGRSTSYPMNQQDSSTGTIDPNFNFSSPVLPTFNFSSKVAPDYKFGEASKQSAFPITTGFPSSMNLSAVNPNNKHQQFFANKLAESSNMGTSIDGSKQDKKREEAKNTITSWQTPQLYGGKDIASSAYSFGNYAKNKDVPGMIFSGLNAAIPIIKAGAAGYATANRENYNQKSFSENLKDAFTGRGSEEALGANGGYYSQGAILPMYQDGDIYGDQEGYKNDLISKYGRSTSYPMNQQDVDSYGSDNIYGDQEGYKNDLIDKYARPKAYPTNQQEAYQEQIGSQKGYVTPTIDPNSARDVWTAKTGLSWAEAKKRGYTDGSASGNKALLDRFGKENVASILENKPKRASTRVARATQNKTQTAPKSTQAPYTEQQAAADYAAYRKQNPTTKRNTGKITASEEGNMITRAGEILANPIQSFGHLAKYGEMPAEGFSKNNKNAYDQVIGLANPLYWANAVGNAADYASEGEYKKAAFEALDALPAAGKIKYVRYLPLDKASKLAVEKAIPLLSKKGALTAAEKAIVYEAKTVSDVAIRQAAKPITGMAKYYPKGSNQIGQGPLNMYYDPLQLASGARQLTSGAKQLGSGAPQLSQGARRLGFEEGGYYQEGGMQPGPEEQMEGQMSNPQEEGAEQQGGDQMQQVMQEVSQALQQGANPQEVVQQLVQMGMPEEQATQIVQQVLEMMQQQEGQQAPPQLRRGGYYQEGGEMMDEGAEGETPNMEQIEGQVEQALKQGADPQQVLQQLVQMGMPEEQAVQMIQEILQEIQGGETEQEAPEQPMMRDGGNYLSALKGKTIKNYTYNSKTGNYDVEFE
jgi:X-X-X-Leu-X-X-Gly heptad repeat protein